MTYQRTPPLNRWQINLHWLSVLLLVVVYCTMEFRGQFAKGSDIRDAMKMVHFYAGQMVLLLALLRLVLHRLYPTTASGPAHMRWLASGAHLALYAFMVAMPLMGWALLNLEGKSLSYLGMELPQLLAKNQTWAERVEAWHETGALIGYGLIGLHAAAALVHHYLLRDNTLRAMRPWG